MLLYCSREVFMTIWKAHSQGWLGAPDNPTQAGHQVPLVVLLGIWETAWCCKKSEFSSCVLVIRDVAAIANTRMWIRDPGQRLKQAGASFPLGPHVRTLEAHASGDTPIYTLILWAGYLFVISTLSDLLNYDTTQWNRYSKTGFQH